LLAELRFATNTNHAGTRRGNWLRVHHLAQDKRTSLVDAHMYFGHYEFGREFGK
tara:strand:+ start:238 stop:399 length:162 start_codon:yes stop_codon:yes gene_type:complete